MKNYPDFSLLLVDDEEAWLRSLSIALLSVASISNVLTCKNAMNVMDILARNDVGLVLLDLTMPHVKGEDLLVEIRNSYPNTKVIVVTGRNEVDTAIHCIKKGAFDYYIKVWGEGRLVTGIQHAIKIVELERQSQNVSNHILDRELEKPEAFSDMVTCSDKMMDIFRYIEAIAPSREPIIITGESGVGKEQIARAIHAVSGKGELISVNMAGLDDTMLDDTLFGHKRGAFTSARDERGGLVQKAGDGTLFLDEIGELSITAQAKLLRFIQEREYYPIGSDKPSKVSCRIVVATNRDISEGRKDGTFRNDLFFRFSHRIHVPALRQRREEIPLLLSHFIDQATAVYERDRQTISPDALLFLSRYHWPGNIREMQKLLFHMASLKKSCLEVDDFAPLLENTFESENNVERDKNLLSQLIEMEELPTFLEMKQLMTNAAMIRSNGKQVVAAKMLGISQPALSKRLKADREE
ncbi:sigma-54 dependent transcriptional regulator [uncultured Cohaesibacter sp.]|uniref:sigma-54-dependent transcriptional regulator n=1 Tax=uncultured Cohaesibacter sp. TaxID=1002546 RepID=UPI00292E8DB1|nr:sigma-54 dependent transcriptional regulator [uncultured Cohaesibacter sp.]